MIEIFFTFLRKGFKIKDKSNSPKIISLSEEFHFEKFDEFQFIIYLDFLLILKYNEETSDWNGKVFSLCLEDDSLFEKIISIKIKLNKEAKFSYAEIKERIYLFSISISGSNLPAINYWEIQSQLSGISTDYQIKGKKII